LVSFVSVAGTVDIGISSVDCFKVLDSDIGTDMDTGTDMDMGIDMGNNMDMGMETDIGMNMEKMPSTRTWIFKLFQNLAIWLYLILTNKKTLINNIQLDNHEE
jgi:hypothetical protein